MAPISLRFELPSVVSTKSYDKIIPPSIVNLNRNRTISTKASSCTTSDSSATYGSSSSSSSSEAYDTPQVYDSSSTNGSSSTSSYYRFPFHRQDEFQNDNSTLSYDNSSLTTNTSSRTTEKSDTIQYLPEISEASTTEESLSESHYILVEEVEDIQEVRNEDDEQLVDDTVRSRSITLKWDNGNSHKLSCWAANDESSYDDDDEHELPSGISKSDIMVTVDIDDEARSSRVEALDEEDLDVEILHHKRRSSGSNSPRKQRHQQRQDFENSVQKGILDDLSSVYTATPNTAKLVLCVVISVMSDGTLEHTFWSGGRVGLTELALQWVLFDADNLQVFKRGRTVQKRDFGFGPLGLTQTEGQHYLTSSLAPWAANDIMRNVGYGVLEDLLVEI